MKIRQIVFVGSCAAILVAGTGCKTGTATSGGGLQCGPTYATPNYVAGTDPGNGQANFVLYWPSYPVNLYFANSDSRDFGAGPVSTTDTFLQGFQKWLNASGGDASFTIVTNQLAAQITFEVLTISGPPGAGEVLGVTNVTYYPSNSQLVSAHIKVNVWPGMTQAQFVEGLRHTITHELGHALFMQGHSNVLADVMYYQGSMNSDSPLTQRDVNSLLTAYCGQFRSRSRLSPLPGEVPVTRTISCRAGS